LRLLFTDLVMTRFIFGFSGVLFAGSIAAFFLFVAPMLIATVAGLLMGFMLMFVLGVQVGARRMLLVESAVERPLPVPADIAPARL
jgi:hypothetical protein